MPDSLLGQVPRKISLPGTPIIVAHAAGDPRQLAGRSSRDPRARTWRKGAMISKVLQALLGAHEMIDFQAWMERGLDFTKLLEPELPVVTGTNLFQRGYDCIWNVTADVLTANTITFQAGRADKICVVKNISCQARGVVANGAGSASCTIASSGGAQHHILVTEQAIGAAAPSADDIKQAYFPGPYVIQPGDRMDLGNGYVGPGAGANLQTIISFQALQYPIGYNGFCGC